MSPAELLREELAMLRRQRPMAEVDLERAQSRLQYIDNRIKHYTVLLESEIKRCERAVPHKSEDTNGGNG